MQVKTKGARKITFLEFQTALASVAAKKARALWCAERYTRRPAAS
jgi:hypothetical protein